MTTGPEPLGSVDPERLRPSRARPAPTGCLYVPADFRFGTFGHSWESTLCVWGAELLAEVSAELTALLGAPVRELSRG